MAFTYAYSSPVRDRYIDGRVEDEEDVAEAA